MKLIQTSIFPIICCLAIMACDPGLSTKGDQTKEKSPNKKEVGHTGKLIKQAVIDDELIEGGEEGPVTFYSESTFKESEYSKKIEE